MFNTRNYVSMLDWRGVLVAAFLLISMLFLYVGCATNSGSDDAFETLIADLPPATELFELNRELTDSDTHVVLGWQGGPLTALLTSHAARWIGQTDLPVAAVMQGQVYDPTLLPLIIKEDSPTQVIFHADENADAPTDAEAAAINRLSYAILEKVRRHFADQGLKTSLFGQSFGAYMIPGLLQQVGNKFEKIVFMNGRVAATDAHIGGLMAGVNIGFQKTADPDAAGFCAYTATGPINLDIGLGNPDIRSRVSVINPDPSMCASDPRDVLAYFADPDCPLPAVAVKGTRPYYSKLISWQYAWMLLELQADALSNFDRAEFYQMDLSNMIIGTGRADGTVGTMIDTEIAALEAAGATVCVTNDGHIFPSALADNPVSGTRNILSKFLAGEKVTCPIIPNNVSCS